MVLIEQTGSVRSGVAGKNYGRGFKFDRRLYLELKICFTGFLETNNLSLGVHKYVRQTAFSHRTTKN